MHVTFIVIMLTVVNARKQFDDLPEPSKHESIEDDNITANKSKSEIDQQAINFGHVYREGFGDSEYKQPVDALELDMIKPRDPKHAMELLLKSDPKNIQFIKKNPPLVFLSPRDEMEYYKQFYNTTEYKKNQKLISDVKTKTSSGPMYDFSSILEKNLANPFASRRSKAFAGQNREFSLNKGKKAMPRKLKNVTEYFQDNAFYKKPDKSRVKINWTTCNEFAKNAVFHPNDIVNTKWLPFFIWSKREFTTTVLHTFSYPTKKTVQRFKTAYGPHIKNVDWKQPKLLLKERRDILLIAGDRKGLFYGIPEQELSPHPLFNNVTLPTIKIRMKIHDPYLAMMYCEEHYAVIMAELGTEPSSKREAILEAKTLNFKGKGAPVRRDIATENFFVKLERKRKMEDESKKIIRIHKVIGDVDEDVNH